jgi:hypothetical protein
MKELIFAVLLIALCSLMAGCVTEIASGITAVKSLTSAYEAGSGNSQEQDAARHWDPGKKHYYRIINGERVYEP